MSKGEATRQAIVQHAMGLASALGLEGLSIGKLASDLKLSKSGLFAHFQSKEQLQLQVLDAAAAEFRRLVVEPVLAKAPGREQLHALYERWLAWGRHNPGGCIFVATAIELDDRPGPARDRLVELQKIWIDRLRGIALAAVEAGEFAPGSDASAFAQEMYGIMLGLYFHLRLLRDPHAEKRARRAFEGLLDRFRPQR
jgi:AcrR family transcriptional regulator